MWKFTKMYRNLATLKCDWHIQYIMYVCMIMYNFRQIIHMFLYTHHVCTICIIVLCVYMICIYVDSL